jgi:hypothetical protein
MKISPSQNETGNELGQIVEIAAGTDFAAERPVSLNGAVAIPPKMLRLRIEPDDPAPCRAANWDVPKPCEAQPIPP